jgi:5-methyltetrahydropteroyltriglutamate--homocysteine methyltransferase
MNPPFRADQVGSLLRPARLHEARAQFQRGEIRADELRRAEDAAIRDAVAHQEAIGLRAISDGEFRRTFFHLDFLEKLDGVTISSGTMTKFHTTSGEIDFAPPKVTISGKLGHPVDIQRADFEFLASVTTKGVPKVAIPSPTMTHFRGGRKGIDIDAYPEMEGFFADLARVYREEIDSLYKAGCRYLQFDDTNLAYLCDPNLRQQAKDRGDDPNTLPHAYAELINAVVADRPDDLIVGIHLCRGNMQSAWVGAGGYEPVAEVLFQELDVDAYFLEYDDERSGDFAPLRFLPKNKVAVLGLVSSKVPAMESEKDVTDRISEAARFAPLENLALSPQCGFASAAVGNNITEDAQWAKLKLCVDIARQVWGE